MGTLRRAPPARRAARLPEPAGDPPADAGHGYGQAYLALDLARWDAAGIPMYLESSNSANDHRHERQGFRTVGEFETVLDHAVVSTMWRPVGG